MSIVAQLAIGTVTVALTIIMQACFAAIAFSVDDRFTPPRTRTTRFGATLLLAASTIWMLLAITLAAWIWAGLFIVLGAFEALEPALYFATVSLTTLGFGDVILSQDVRLLCLDARSRWMRLDEVRHHQQHGWEARMGCLMAEP